MRFLLNAQHGKIFFFTFQLQHGQNGTTSEKGDNLSEMTRVIDFPLERFWAVGQYFFWPNQLFLTSLTILIIKVFP